MNMVFLVCCCRKCDGGLCAAQPGGDRGAQAGGP